MKPSPAVVVIGAGGSQAQAMLEAAARATDLSTWVAIDRSWRPEVLAKTQAMDAGTLEFDALAEPDLLADALASAKVAVNLAGPYYRTGTAVLDAAIAAGTDYMDICDDADVVMPMLSRNTVAESVGVRALIGMGASPGMTNVLIRAAVDHLGPVQDVDIHWTVDVADITNAAIRHFWHCFNMVEPDGSVHQAASWEQLDRRTIRFPGTVGDQTVVRLAHPEPLTIPMFLPVQRSTNYGAITPEEALVVAWSLAYSVDAQRRGAGRATDKVTDAAVSVFESYRDTRPPAVRVGSGLSIDVHTDGTGLRFSSGAEIEMAEATGVPAAAGILLMLDGMTPPAGVFSPENLRPVDFFAALRRVSRGGGGLTTSSLRAGQTTGRIRLRDLIADGPIVGG